MKRVTVVVARVEVPVTLKVPVIMRSPLIVSPVLRTKRSSIVGDAQVPPSDPPGVSPPSKFRVLPLQVRASPAVILVLGVVLKLCHSVVEAVRGMEYPLETVGVKVWVDPEETMLRPMPVAVPVAKV